MDSVNTTDNEGLQQSHYEGQEGDNSPHYCEILIMKCVIPSLHFNSQYCIFTFCLELSLYGVNLIEKNIAAFIAHRCRCFDMNSNRNVFLSIRPEDYTVKITTRDICTWHWYEEVWGEVKIGPNVCNVFSHQHVGKCQLMDDCDGCHGGVTW